jgi:hypothetical protein
VGIRNQRFEYFRLLQQMRDRFSTVDPRFYFLCVRNEILLHGYIRDKVRVSRFSRRVGERSLMQVSRCT